MYKDMSKFEIAKKKHTTIMSICYNKHKVTDELLSVILLVNAKKSFKNMRNGNNPKDNIEQLNESILDNFYQLILQKNRRNRK